MLQKKNGKKFIKKLWTLNNQMRRGPKRIEIPGKKWNEKFIHEKKTWHVVHKQDGITFAVCELRPGVVGGLVERFYI